MQSTKVPGSAEAPFLRFETLKKRADFLRAAKGRRNRANGFVLQGWNRGDTNGPRVGYTCSKKVGNAVARNRAKRRLREIARLVIPQHGCAGWDYVLIGRAEKTAALAFSELCSDLELALTQLHDSMRSSPNRGTHK